MSRRKSRKLRRNPIRVIHQPGGIGLAVEVEPAAQLLFDGRDFGQNFPGQKLALGCLAAGFADQPVAPPATTMG